MLTICLRFASKVQFQDVWSWEDQIITSPVKHKHDTSATGQRDVRQHENAERMTSQTVDARGLVEVFEDSHDFVLLLNQRGYITYANHSARRLFQTPQQDCLDGSYSEKEFEPKNDRYPRLVTDTAQNYSDEIDIGDSRPVILSPCIAGSLL